MATGRSPDFQEAVEAWLDMFREDEPGSKSRRGDLLKSAPRLAKTGGRRLFSLHVLRRHWLLVQVRTVGQP